MKASHRQLLLDLLSLPTSPLNEQHVAAWIRQWVERRSGIRLETDRFGNLRLRLRRDSKRSHRPLVMSAHMDHPGFEAEGMLGGNRLRALWRGGVSPDYFVGTKVRFFVDGHWIRGVVQSIQRQRKDRRRVASATVTVAKAVPAGAIGVWDLPGPTVRGNRLYAGACDDLAGVAAILISLDELYLEGQALNVFATFTRAEEVGFAGALAGGQHDLLPQRARIVAIETSSEIPGVSMGHGPILRVGDRSAVFSPDLTAACRQVGDALQKRSRRFRYQRKLMDGGTCESAAFCELGHDATGLCLALGHYHNMNTRRKCIAAEYIDLGDFENLVRWLKAIALADPPRTKGNPAFRQSLQRLRRQWSPLLKRTANRTAAQGPG